MKDEARAPASKRAVAPRQWSGRSRAGDAAPAHASARPSGGQSRRRRPRAWTIAEMANLRAIAYRLFATVFLYPNARRLDWLSGKAAALSPYDEALASFAFFTPWRRFLDALRGIDAGDTEALQAEHVRLFSINPTGDPCFAYESRYAAPRAGDTGELTARLLHTYAVAGLKIDPSVNENPDHVSVELEFMAYLCLQEAETWTREATEEGLRALAQQRAFLRSHLRGWFAGFASAVRAVATGGLYAIAADAAEAFIDHDADLVENLLTDIGDLRNQSKAQDDSNTTGAQ